MNLQVYEDVEYHVPELLPTENKVCYSLIKRCFDIIFSIIGIVLSLIPMIVAGIAIKCDSHGSVIYRQERLGKNGKPFNILKLRTMVVDAEKNGAQWATKNDVRVTKVGKFLRKTRIDEIPQFWNVLAGQMSFVGPRPERACFYKEFESYVDGFAQRMRVIPGITGWAQTHGGYDLPPEEKLVYDMEYIDNRGILMDVICLCRTVKVIFTGSGSR